MIVLTEQGNAEMEVMYKYGNLQVVKAPMTIPDKFFFNTVHDTGYMLQNSEHFDLGKAKTICDFCAENFPELMTDKMPILSKARKKEFVFKMNSWKLYLMQET